MISRTFRCLLVVTFVVAASAFAQETRGTIVGHVFDEQGGAMPGVSVTITNVDTNVSATQTTNSTGYYQAPLLLPGNYRVSAELQGFKTSVRSGIIEDVYLTLVSAPNEGRVTVGVRVNPAVLWLWIGAAVMVAGTAVAAVPPTSRRRRRTHGTAPPAITELDVRVDEPVGAAAGHLTRDGV